MQTWKLPVVYQFESVVEIDADTLEEAIEIFNNEFIEIPEDGQYIEDSLELCNDGDIDNIKEFNKVL